MDMTVGSIAMLAQGSRHASVPHDSTTMQILSSQLMAMILVSICTDACTTSLLRPVLARMELDGMRGTSCEEETHHQGVSDMFVMPLIMMTTITTMMASTERVPGPRHDPGRNSIMVAEPVVRQPWALRCWEAVAEEETAKVDEMLEVNLAHDDQRSAATIVPGGSGEPEQCSSTSVAVARGSLARRRVE